MNKPKHGGKRLGSGRPKKEATTTVAFRVRLSHVESYDGNYNRITPNRLTFVNKTNFLENTLKKVCIYQNRAYLYIINNDTNKKT